jgi:hypothetical protein
MTAKTPEPIARPAPEDEDDLSPEEAAEIEQRSERAEETVRRGEAIPWEALFPPRKRLAG